MKWLALAFLMMATPALADDKLDCKDPQDQSSMTQCAALDFEKADTQLNSIWPKIKANAVSNDEGTGKHEYADALLASQRTWLAYLEAQCKWQGFDMHGGSGEPMLYYGCKARLTTERIKELQLGTE